MAKIDWNDEEVRKVYRHTASHIMAQAIKHLWPDTKLAIGPSIDNGFYYDFESSHTFVEADFLPIQKEMKKIIQANLPLERFELPREEAIKLGGKIAGICYDKEGFEHLDSEPEEKTMRRVNMTLNNGHHSVYDHINISFNIQNIPKILAMILNNEKIYNKSEKSRLFAVKKGEQLCVLSRFP